MGFGEKLVAQHRGDSIFTEPLKNCTEALPYMYRISEDASGGFQLHPMEFVYKPTETYKAKHHAVVSNAAFLHEFSATLRERGILSKFGLTLLHRQDILGNKTVETSAGPRKLVVNIQEDGNAHAMGDEEPDVEIRTVIFAVPDVPGIHGLDACKHQSCSHCRNHK